MNPVHGWKAGVRERVRQTVSGTIDFSDDNIVGFFELFGELFVLGLELFAVAAPGSINLEKHVLFGVKNDGLDGFADNCHDFAGLGSGWDWLGFHPHVQFAGVDFAQK